MRRNTNEAATGTTYATTKHPNAKWKIIEKRKFGNLFTFDSIILFYTFRWVRQQSLISTNFYFIFHQFSDSKNENKNKMSTLLRTRYASELNWRTALVFWYIVWLWLWLCACVYCVWSSNAEYDARNARHIFCHDSWYEWIRNIFFLSSSSSFFWFYVYISTVSRNWKGVFELKRNHWSIWNERFHRSSNENRKDSPMKNWKTLFFIQPKSFE